MSTAVAVLGLGAMGLPMATHLASAGFDVRGYDISAERAALLEGHGRVETDPREACDGADVVLLAVRNAEQLDTVLWGEVGVAPVLAPGAVVLLTSTVGIEAARTAAARLAEAGLHLVDAPISGGPVRAGRGDLLVTVGADDAGWAAALPVLEAMSSTLVRVGNAPGDGQSMKTVNQLLCGIHIAAAGEALALARALGLDPAVALETLGAGAAQSFMLMDRGKRMLRAYDEDEVEVMSRLDIFVKDMGIVTAAARSVGLATPLASTAQQQFLIGQAHGMAGADDSSVIKVVAPEPPASA